MRILIQGSLAAQQICFPGIKMPWKIEENSLIFQFETAIRLEETEIISQGKKKKGKKIKFKKSQRKNLKKTPT